MGYSFDGNDSFSLGNGADLNPNGDGSALTMSCWVIDTSENEDDHWIVARDDDTLGRAYSFGFRFVPASTLSFRLQINGAATFYKDAAFSTNALTHLVYSGTNGGAGSWKGYVNGTLLASPTVGDGSATAMASTTGVTAIGQRTRAAESGFLAGVTVYEIGMWNAVLTQAEVTLLSKRYSPLFVRPASLISYPPLVRPLVDYIRTPAPAVLAGAPTLATHIPMIMPRSHQIRRYTAGAAPPAEVIAASRLRERQVIHWGRY